MKILLIHPEDDPEQGPWASVPWNQIVDLGLAGTSSYARWTKRFECPVMPLAAWRNGFDDFHRVRDLMDLGCGRLIDDHGLDWWEIMSILLHGELETLILLQTFAHTIGPADEVHVSRRGLHANLLQFLARACVQVFDLRPESQQRGLGHYVRISNKLSAAQMADVFFDKYDPGYQARGRLRRPRPPSKTPRVLLPTAYVNVSRTAIAYAQTFPRENFLLVATRRSGWLRQLPENAEAAWLSSYASLRDRSAENAAMETRWRSLVGELRKVREFEILRRLGHLDSFPSRFRHGFEVRDAWRNVLEREPVQAVLCADDSNPYTRLPLLLARERGLPNIACHHGALDGRYLFKRSHGDVIWAKGAMEEDYLARKCGVPRKRIEIAAPAPPPHVAAVKRRDSTAFRPNILFISEAYDVSGGRTEDFYRDILPPLADLAVTTTRKLVVKLHPAESRRERSQTLARLLSAKQRAVVSIVSGPLTESLLESAWFGITILSTVAVECAIRGIPCFLCKWLESWPYEYVDQFIRFGVGIGLNSANEIERIPEQLLQYSVSPDVMKNCCQPAASGRLREFFTGPREIFTTAAS